MKYFTIGFTGTQRGMNGYQFDYLWELIKKLKPDFGVHGDCIGADNQFHDVCKLFKVSIHIYPPKNNSKRAFCEDAEYIFRTDTYLERNKSIVNNCDLLIATPSGKEQLRSGTWATIRYARKVNKPRIILLP